jgi:hypothetical protein
MKPDLDIQIWYPDDFPNRPHQHNRLANRILALVALTFLALIATLITGTWA